MNGEQSITTLCDRMMLAFVDAVLQASRDSRVGVIRDRLGRDGWADLAIPILRARLKAMLAGPEYESGRRAVLDGVHLADKTLFAAVLADCLSDFTRSGAGVAL